LAPVATPKQIAEDLVALSDEFEEVELDMRARTITARTQPIELKGLYLGPFSIVLSWSLIGTGCPYEVVAVDPQPASRNDEVVHPHVQSNMLCEGDARLPIQRALQQGRLFDYFVVVRQVLETYNSGSAYVDIDKWNGGCCADCDWSFPADEGYSCEHCTSVVCGECVSTCSCCDVFMCGECTGRCEKCEQPFCFACLELCSDCRSDCCKECLTDEKCFTCRQVDEERPMEGREDRKEATCDATADAPLHAHCVGEARVPA
jgi:hypothetical protein